MSSKKIFISGELNKKILIPLFLSLGQVLINIFNEYYPEDSPNFILDLYSISIGQIAIIFLPYLYKIHLDINKNYIIGKRKKFFHYFLLCLFKFVNIITIALALFIKGKLSEDNIQVKSPKSVETFFEQGIQMVLLAVISIFLLNYKYYIHNIIAIILFLCSSLGIDFIVGYFKIKIETHYLAIILEYVYILTDCINICYIKYMMEKWYYPYWNLYFVLGLFLFSVATIALFIILILGKNSDILFVQGFFGYFEKTNIGIILGKILITMVLYFFQSSLYILTLFYFSPDYILIMLQFSKLTNLLFNLPSKHYYFLILFIFQIFCLLIYLEIIELNFLGLNKNTKRNIRTRSLSEILVGKNNNEDNDTDNQGIIDVNQEYYYNDNINENDNDGSTIELNSK